MLARFSRLSYLASTALALSIAGNQANANPTIQNPDFLNITGSPKETFSNAAPVGWSGGTNLVFIASSSTSSSNASSPCGSTYLQTYGCPSALIISGGYNVVESDGNPTYNSSFYQTLTGLTVGENYSLSFYQAASQQSGFSGATTNQWIVGLGKTGTYLEAVKNSGGSNTSNCGPVNCYQSTDTSAKGASIAASTLMSVPSGGLQNWEYVSVLMRPRAQTRRSAFSPGAITATLPTCHPSHS